MQLPTEFPQGATFCIETLLYLIPFHTFSLYSPLQASKQAQTYYYYYFYYDSFFFCENNHDCLAS